MKHPFLLSILLFSLETTAQHHVHFAYDASGNCIKKTVIVSKSMTRDMNDVFRGESFIVDQDLDIKSSVRDGKLTLYFAKPAEKSCEYVLYDTAGAVLSKGEIKDTRHTIDMTEYNAGAYVLCVYIDGRMASVKIQNR